MTASRWRGASNSASSRKADGGYRNAVVCINILVEMHLDSGALTGHTRSSAEELLVEIKRTPIALSCQRDPLGAHGMVCVEPM